MSDKWLYGFLFMLCTLGSCSGDAQDITLATNGSSDYSIVIPAEPTKLEQRSANVLQRYLFKISGVQVPVLNEGVKLKTPGIYIGHTSKLEKWKPGKMIAESSSVFTDGKDLVFFGGSGRGILYGVYSFIEDYLHCKKISSDSAVIIPAKTLLIPGKIKSEHHPEFSYRQVYYPMSQNAEYLEWNELQQFEDLWGTRMWGHTYFKLVPPQTYFNTHPEYFSLVKGKRQATQLCLTNDDVFHIVVNELKKRMADDPDAMYWSVSPNDDNGYCECDKCKAVDNAAGSPSGSLIKFVNRVAEAFPDKSITTLAYGYTHKAPRNMKPAANVYVFLSNIDAYRDKPLADEGSAAAFRTDLKAWSELTGNLFVWDYITQFTNYLAPFPNLRTLQPNIQYLKENGVKGIFAQGSGDTYSEFAELRGYLQARLMENDKADVKELTTTFLQNYYGSAAPFIQQYLTMLEGNMIASKRKLDIYGNPVNEWKYYLSPEYLDAYSTLFDKAEAAVEGNDRFTQRVMMARLPLEYTVLQQARFYGVEKFGIFVRDKAGDWSVKPKFQEKVARFVSNCKKAGVTELSEGGLTPDKYQAEWNDIFKAGVTPTKALGATVTLQNPFAEDYPAKGNRTLTDGNPGYYDFSYNWLCFYGVPMIATIDLGKSQDVSTVKMHFLDDPRHWIFLPEKIKVEVSADGVSYHSIGDLASPPNNEHYDLTIRKFETPKRKAQPARYIRVTANNLSTLPAWRFRENKKPMIACDEIFVQ